MIPHECKCGRLSDFFSRDTEYEEVTDFFAKVGLENTSYVCHITGTRGEEDKYKHGIEIEPGKRQLSGDEWEIFTDTDDYSIAVYYEGKPKGGFYVSTRGSLYQAGCYIVDEQQHYWSNNLNRKGGWEKGQDIDSEIAHDWLYGEKE